MSEENIVFVTCNGNTHQFFIDDIDPEFLKATFELLEAPTTLFSVASNLAIPIAKKTERLKSGDSYYIKFKKKQVNVELDECDSYTKYTQRIKYPEDEKEVILNSLVASTAIYYNVDESDMQDGGECGKYLLEQLNNHNFEYIVRNKFGSNNFLIAKELNNNRIYIAFRGTKDLNDWKYNLQAFRERCGSRIRGKFHSGFLQRALNFPMETILNDNKFKDSDVVLCGHSLGGAIASIVTIRIQLERARYKLNGNVQCVTFGAPLFGDEELSTYLENDSGTLSNIVSKIRNFVCSEDPVPKLLSYTQSLASFSSSLDHQISLIVNTFGATQEGASYHRQNKDKLIAQKDICMETLSKLVPLADTALEITSLVVPQANWARTGRNIASLLFDLSHCKSDAIGDYSKSNIPKNYVYVPIGNFHFLDEELMLSKDFSYTDQDGIKDYLDYLITRQQREQRRPQNQTNAHALNHYESLLRRCKNIRLPFGSYPTFQDLSVCYGETVHTSIVERLVKFRQLFTPQIHKAELIRVISPNEQNPTLRLTLTGRCLFDIVLDKCQFQIGFPFGVNVDKVTIKKLSTGENLERLVLEEALESNNGNSLLAISDHGLILILATQFGLCEYILCRDNIRDLPIPTVNQIAQHDSVSMLIRKALQRGMAFAQIKKEAGIGCGISKNEQIIQEIIDLGLIALSEKEMEDMKKLFHDNSNHIQFILSNEEEFRKVKEFCNKIELFLKSPMRIEAEKSVAQKIGIALAIVAGGGAVGYIAGPGLVLIGILGEVSATGLATGTALGAISAGMSARAILYEQMVDSVYENALKWIVQELVTARQEKLSSDKRQEVSDLRDDGSIFSNEKALMLLYNPDMDADNGMEPSNEFSVFQNCSISGCTASSKETVIRRIKAIQKIHKIRKIFAQQCFIGIVGIQDAGKTTLLKKIWGVGGKTGYFSHTDVPMMYEINRRLFVVDFPGSNSLDYHAKTFSICGAMNNMIILVIPFTGDVSQLVSEEVARVFSVMKGSDATQVIVCINKCGPFVERMNEELTTQTDEMVTKDGKTEDNPISFLRKRFIERLNEYYANSGLGIKVELKDILFTDWIMADSPSAKVKDFGLCGVEDVKHRIKQYLIKYGIYHETEEHELLQSVSTLSRN